MPSESTQQDVASQPITPDGFWGDFFHMVAQIEAAIVDWSLDFIHEMHGKELTGCETWYDANKTFPDRERKSDLRKRRFNDWFLAAKLEGMSDADAEKEANDLLDALEL